MPKPKSKSKLKLKLRRRPEYGLPMTGPRRVKADDRLAHSAAQRCRAYAACSELLASPHDVDPRPALLGRIGLGDDWPAARGLEAWITALGESELAPIRADYSGLFEVGDTPAPSA